MSDSISNELDDNSADRISEDVIGEHGEDLILQPAPGKDLIVEPKPGEDLTIQAN